MIADQIVKQGAGVIVCHPGTQHSYETALAMQKCGLLREYVTSIYFKSNSLFARAQRYLPGRTGVAIRQIITRRSRTGLDDASVQTLPLLEMVYLASTRIPFATSIPGNIMLMRNGMFDRTVAKRVRRIRPAAVIAYDSCALETFRAATRVGALKVLDQTNAHLAYWAGVLDEEAERVKGYRAIKRPHPELIARCIAEAKEADLILAGSNFVRASLDAVGIDSSKTVVLPYGVDVGLFKPKIPLAPKKCATIVFAGQIGLRKGVSYLLDAVAGLRGVRCRLQLIGQVVDDGEWLKRYANHFTHVPFVPREKLVEYLQEADLFVYPSLSEGSALAIYEALACGLPVLTTPNSGSVVRDSIEGYIVPPRDVEALRDRIGHLLLNSGLRSAMASAARARAEEYSWNGYHMRLAELIRKALGLGDSHPEAADRATTEQGY
ncbi:MAG: glycosyltransferase family 4 protein [Candidatus Binataceae bacterium]